MTETYVFWTVPISLMNNICWLACGPALVDWTVKAESWGSLFKRRVLLNRGDRWSKLIKTVMELSARCYGNYIACSERWGHGGHQEMLLWSLNVGWNADQSQDIWAQFLAPLYFLPLQLYWDVIDIEHCVSLRCTTRWFIHIYIVKWWPQ